MSTKTRLLLDLTIFFAISAALIVWLAGNSTLPQLSFQISDAAVLHFLRFASISALLITLGIRFSGPRAVQPFEEARTTRKLGATPAMVDNDWWIELDE